MVDEKIGEVGLEDRLYCRRCQRDVSDRAAEGSLDSYCPFCGAHIRYRQSFSYAMLSVYFVLLGWIKVLMKRGPIEFEGAFYVTAFSIAWGILVSLTCRDWDDDLGPMEGRKKTYILILVAAVVEYWVSSKIII